MNSYRGITYRYLKGQKKRTILTCIGIILSVALITAIGTMIVSMRQALIEEEIKRTGDYHVIFKDIDGSKVNKIQNNVEVQDSSITSEYGYGIVSKVSDREKENNPEAPPYIYLKLKGYDTNSFKMFPIIIEEGRLPYSSDEIIVDSWVLEHFAQKPKIGDKIKLDIGKRQAEGEELQDNSWNSEEEFIKTGEKEYTIVGLTKQKYYFSGSYFANGVTCIDNKNLEKNKVYDVNVKMDSVKGVKKRAEKIAQQANLNTEKSEDGVLIYPIKYNQRILALSAESLNKTLNKTLFLTLIFIIVLVVVSTIAVIYNAFNISVLERTSQFGVLRSVGATPDQIKYIVLKEAFILSLIGIPIGAFCGVNAMKIVMAIIGSLGTGELEILDNLNIVISYTVLIISSCLGLFTVLLSAYGPAKRAAKVSPLEAIRNTGEFKKEGFKKVRKRRIENLFKIDGQIAIKNTRRNRKRFRITVFSMVISIVLYITFGSFLDYMFKVGAVNTDEVGDFYVTMYGRSGEGLSEDDFRKIKSLDQVEYAFKDMYSYSEVYIPFDKVNQRFREINKIEQKDGMARLYNGAILCYGDDGFKELKKHLKQGKIDKDSLNGEDGVLLINTNKSYADKKSIFLNAIDCKVGDKLKLKTRNKENEEYKTVKVLGILEKGILDNQYNENEGVYLITTEEVYKKIVGEDTLKGITIKLKKDADREKVSEYLKKLSNDSPQIRYTDYGEEAKERRKMNIIMSIFLYGFVGVITLIGCLNIINTISTNLILRTREFSMLKAVGMSNGGIKRLVCYESMIYGIISAIYGGIIGTGLSYVLFNIWTEISEFSWSIPWKNIIVSSVGATIVALISGAIPLRRINNGNITENIRMEQ